MKFPRNARIFRGQLDAAPFVAVLFLLVIFMMLGTLVYTPGVALQLPQADDLPGTDKPIVSVAIDAGGRLYFKNQGISREQLRERLSEAVANSAEPLTLVIEADQDVSYESLFELWLLARDARIAVTWQAALPRPLASQP